MVVGSGKGRWPEPVTYVRTAGFKGVHGVTKRVGNVPLVAIGGIKFEQAAEVFAAGADSIAVVSDITQNADPDARVRAWLRMNAEAA